VTRWQANPPAAFAAVLHHALPQRLHRYSSDTCLESRAKSAGFGTQTAGVERYGIREGNRCAAPILGTAVAAEAGRLWEALIGFDGERQDGAVPPLRRDDVTSSREPWNRRPGAFSMGIGSPGVISTWRAAGPHVRKLSRPVPKTPHLEAVREAKGERRSSSSIISRSPTWQGSRAALDGTGWLPERCARTRRMVSR